MDTASCPSCGAVASGAFCSACGAPQRERFCPSCGAATAPEARFCVACGERLGSGTLRSARLLPWLVAGGAVAGLALVLLWQGFRGEPRGTEAAVMAPGAAAPFSGGGEATSSPAGRSAGPPPLTGTPREQADRLFDRVMRSRSAGDDADAEFFAPMAIQAYGMAGELDDDGLYHLSLLHAIAGDPAAARATAERILSRSPDHLLALAAAAAAARQEGEDEDTGVYSRRFLDAYESERSRDLAEYQIHAPILPEYRAEAEAFLSSR